MPDSQTYTYYECTGLRAPHVAFVRTPAVATLPDGDAAVPMELLEMVTPDGEAGPFLRDVQPVNATSLARVINPAEAARLHELWRRSVCVGAPSDAYLKSERQQTDDRKAGKSLVERALHLLSMANPVEDQTTILLKEQAWVCLAQANVLAHRYTAGREFSRLNALLAASQESLEGTKKRLEGANANTYRERAAT